MQGKGKTYALAQATRQNEMNRDTHKKKDNHSVVGGSAGFACTFKEQMDDG